MWIRSFMLAAISAAAMILAFTPAHAAPAPKPYLALYLIPGVTDNGGPPRTGIATIFLCTNNSGTQQTILLSLRRPNGTVAASTSWRVSKDQTVVFATHDTTAFDAEILVAPGVAIQQGKGLITSQSPLFFCSASLVDAAGDPPLSMGALHLVRYNLPQNLQE